MKKEIMTTVRIFFILSLLLGIVYPLVVALIGQLTMHDKANGSLLVKDEKIIGSRLIGQSFDSPQYFHGRPSAVHYNGAASGGSNLGPSSEKLIDELEERITVLRVKEGLGLETLIPAGMVLGSGSGLDPNISIPDAFLQVRRIAEARGLPESAIVELVNTYIDTGFWGLWGQRVVNVLEINLALDLNDESMDRYARSR